MQQELVQLTAYTTQHSAKLAPRRPGDVILHLLSMLNRLCLTDSIFCHRLYRFICRANLHWWCAGSFKQAHGDYSTAILALAALCALTCLLTACFKEPHKHVEPMPGKSKAQHTAV